MTKSVNPKPATILAIETATASCSVALCVAEKVVTLSEVGSNVHSQVLLEMVRDVLEKMDLKITDLDAIAVGQGPGSFTGLRIGVGVAQGLAYGANCPMIGISSLDALAHQASSEGYVIATIDARMGEVYWCEYRASKIGVERLRSLKVTPPQEVMPSTSNKYQLVGNAWQEYQGAFNDQLIRFIEVDDEQTYPTAKSLLELARVAFDDNQLVSPVDFIPEYVRNDVAKKSTKKLF